MTNKFHVLDHPMLLYAGHTTTGHTKDLKAGIIGVFDDKTGTAVTAATMKGNRPVRFAQGSYHSKDSLGTFYKGLKSSLKTADFLPKDVMHIEFSPFAKSQNEKWIFGWDGINDCETLKFECGKTHKFRIRVYGEGVYNEFTKQILRDVSVTTACCDSDECSDGCPDNSVHCRKYTKELVKAINSDVEISKFVRAEVVYPDITAKTMTHKKMCLSVCDNGDQEALNAVQRQYPNMTIERISRIGSTSTYQTGCMLNATVVSDYIPNTPISLAVCGSCPTGYTLVAATDVYIVVRPLAGTEDLTTPATQATYASGIATSYTGTNPIFLGENGSTASVQFEVPAGTTVTALLADTVVKSLTKDQSCTPTAATPIAWVQCASGYVTTRSLVAVIGKECDGSSRLAEVQAFYAGDTSITSITITEVGTCEDKYQITQQSECMGPDGCLTEELPVFSAIAPFEGTAWGEDACATPVVPTEQNLCGIRLEVSSNYNRFGDCSWVPEDYYTFKPTMMEIWEVEEDGAPCKKQVTARKIQNVQIARQSGEWVAREYINLAAYLYHNAFDTDTRLREILDQTIYQIIDKSAFYNIFYVKYKQYRGSNFEGNMQNAETYEIPIVVKDGVDVTSFINYLNAMFGPLGVTVQPRTNQPNY